MESKNEGNILKEINALEPSLVTDPENVIVLCKLCELYEAIDRKAKAILHLNNAIKYFLSKQISSSQGLLVAECAYKHWKSIKYSNKEGSDLRINIMPDRAQLLLDTHKILDILIKMRDTSLSHKINFLMALVKAAMGQYQDALALLSDIITSQTNDVDLIYVIFHASIILMHTGNVTQAMEYLEYLLDEPPVSEGYTRTHILALLASVYDKSGDHFSMILERTYDELLQTYSKELAGGKKPITNQKKIDGILAKKSMSQASEVWEMLALQAIERSDYLLGAEMMIQAVEKAPNKGKLQHLLAEIYYMLKEGDRAAKMAERAFMLIPNNTDLRNLLLLVDRNKWQDKLRTVSSSTAFEKDVSADGSTANKRNEGIRASAADGGSSNWLNKLKVSAINAVAAVVSDEYGPSAALLAAMTPEQRAKEVVKLEARKKSKEAKQKKLDEAKKIKEEADKRLNVLASRKKRNELVDGPARPVKPPYNIESINTIHAIRANKLGNKHFYDPSLRGLQIIAAQLHMEEKEKIDKAAALKHQVEYESKVVGPPPMKAKKKKQR